MVTFVGIIIFLAGGALKLLVQKRNFEKTNQNGVQEFDKFSTLYKFGLINRTLSLLSGLMIAIGGLIFAFGIAS